MVKLLEGGKRMIRVEVQTNDDGFMNIQVEGHSKTDICAAVSTLLQSNVRFLQELAKQFPEEVQVRIEDLNKGGY